MDHEVSCSKEEVHQCWTVPDRLKVTNDLEFNAYACDHYILDDGEIADDEADGYVSDGLLPSDKKDEVMDNENSNEDHGESNNLSVEIDCDIFAERGAASPEQYATMRFAKDDSSNIPMSMSNPPPESIIDLYLSGLFLGARNHKVENHVGALPIDNKAVDLARGGTDKIVKNNILLLFVFL
jgi:hypothetical protein